MNLQYGDVFEVRGASYHRAMRRFPSARRIEFDRAFERRPVMPGSTILDVPSGGGYLGAFLGHADITQLELTAGFDPGIPLVSPVEDWPVGTFDHVVCAAALHHIDDQRSFINRLMMHVKPGGTVHLVDASVGSPIGRFLDEFAGLYNQTGHAGNYLPADLASIGFDATILFHGELACPWHFASKADLLEFSNDLFGLTGCTQTELEEALAEYVGIEVHASGTHLNWRLTYADLAAPD